MNHPVSPAIRQLATLIRARREAGDRPYTLLLGSSLSLTPEIRQAVCGSDDWETFWTKFQGFSATERRSLLAGPLDGLNLAAGYRCLAQLVQAGYFDLVLTLNVDDALDESLRILSAREHQILTHGQVPGTEITAALDRTPPRVKVVKLRGDINARKLPLTPEGQFEFSEELEEAVERLLSQDTILVGDVSYDTDIQRCIRQGEGALWVVVSEPPNASSFLYGAKRARPRGEVITGPEAEFVSVFSALARELGGESSEVSDRARPAVRHPIAMTKEPKPVSAPQTITWLHLSDLHFRESRAYDENIVLRALLHDVAERICDDGLQPDFITISGDIAFASRPEEYALAQQFLDDLLETTGLPTDRLFLVPGNHDVDRSAISPLAAGATAILSNRDAANRLLASDADRALVFQRFHNYHDFVNQYFGQHLYLDDVHYFYVKTIEVTGQRVAILGLNSAWLAASDEDKAQGLVIGERQTRAALDAAQTAGTELTIVLLHHPFDWLREFDQNDSAAMLLDRCDFVLHGHLHRTAMTQLVCPDSGAMVIAAGACYETRQYPNSYNFARLDFAVGTGTVYLRRYSDERGGFWAKDTLIYRNVPDGVYTFALRSRSTPLQSGLQPSSTVGDAPVSQRDAYQPGAVAAPNPFGDVGRITDPDRFFGRKELLRRIFEELGKGANVSVVGESQVGKSSLLSMVCTLGPERMGLPPEAFVYLSLQWVDDEDDFYEELCKELDIETCRGGKLRRALRGKHYVLCLDEIERMAGESVGFTVRVRSHLRGLADGPAMPLKLVTASRSPLAHLFPDSPDQESPLAGICPQLDVGPFPPDAARAFLAHRLRGTGVAFSESEISALLAETGGHPANLQRAAATLFDHYRRKAR